MDKIEQIKEDEWFFADCKKFGVECYQCIRSESCKAGTILLNKVRAMNIMIEQCKKAFRVIVNDNKYSTNLEDKYSYFTKIAADAVATILKFQDGG